MIAALYVAKDGAYFGIPDVDPWDESRDARLYAGPHRVVAHPPCSRWCRIRPIQGRRGVLTDVVKPCALVGWVPIVPLVDLGHPANAEEPTLPAPPLRPPEVATFLEGRAHEWAELAAEHAWAAERRRERVIAEKGCKYGKESIR